MKKIVLLMVFFLFKFAYSETFWRGEDNKKLTIIYKVLHPLIVTIEEPERITITKNDLNFLYSNKNPQKKPILVTVKAPYNQKNYDDILRKIYEVVYFKLEDDGYFNLTHINDQTSIIKGEGYFVDDAINFRTQKVKEYSKPFSSKTNGDEFLATTSIDVDFSLDSSKKIIGIYRGTLKLNVWFGGSIQ